MTLATVLVPEATETPVRVTAHAVPDADTAYDDGDPPARPRRPLAPFPTAAPGLRLVPPPDVLDEDEEDDFFEAVKTPRTELDDPLPRAAMLTRALLETINGIRPLNQLAKWVSPDVLAILQSMVASRAVRPAPTALRRVLVSEPAAGVAEVTAIVQRGERAEALAIRLEGLDGRWVVTALQRA
ncbi:MAG TPA: Rv3235 family protein [Frankiaceae bacterium]|nr:Rv3235 family protein [Frankiaceae bacterium]